VPHDNRVFTQSDGRKAQPFHVLFGDRESRDHDAAGLPALADVFAGDYVALPAGDLGISPLSIAEIPQFVEGSASRCRG
jgi:hypothetical protein